jgi:hypothetical protein
MNAFSPLQNLPYAETIPDIVSCHGWAAVRDAGDTFKWIRLHP